MFCLGFHNLIYFSIIKRSKTLSNLLISNSLVTFVIYIRIIIYLITIKMVFAWFFWGKMSTVIVLSFPFNWWLVCLQLHPYTQGYKPNLTYLLCISTCLGCRICYISSSDSQSSFFLSYRISESYCRKLKSILKESREFNKILIMLRNRSTTHLPK